MYWWGGMAPSIQTIGCSLINPGQCKLSVPGNPFRPSLMFPSRAGDYPSGASFRCFLLG